MSFTSSVKNELLAHIPKNGCCMHNFFSGLASFNGQCKMSGGKVLYTFTTENEATANTFCKMSRDLFMINPQKKKSGMIYTFKIDDASLMLCELDIAGQNNAFMHIPQNLSDCCVRAFISGAFISGGSITAPEKRYHLEFETPHFRLKSDFMHLFERFDIPAKCIVRKSKYVIYFKDNEVISDVLALMGANDALWELNNTNILKSIKNRENRIVNCESANIDRVVDASFKQQAAIKYIDTHFGINNLPEQLAVVARLRLENPDLSISEIGKMLSSPLSKSGINHRMRKIIDFAQELKDSNKKSED